MKLNPWGRWVAVYAVVIGAAVVSTRLSTGAFPTVVELWSVTVVYVLLSVAAVAVGWAIRRMTE